VCFGGLNNRLEVISNFLGSYITNEFDSENYKPLWATGNRLVETRVAVQCGLAYLGLLQREIHVHGARTALGCRVPTITQWWNSPLGVPANEVLEDVWENSHLSEWQQKVFALILEEFQFE
jgi:hypothetical protein